MLTTCSRVALLAFLLFVPIGNQRASAQSPSLPMREVLPTPTGKALLNPGMGLYLQCGGGFQPVPEDAWYRETANIAYYRPC